MVSRPPPEIKGSSFGQHALAVTGSGNPQSELQPVEEAEIEVDAPVVELQPFDEAEANGIFYFDF